LGIEIPFPLLPIREITLVEFALFSWDWGGYTAGYQIFTQSIFNSKNNDMALHKINKNNFLSEEPRFELVQEKFRLKLNDTVTMVIINVTKGAVEWFLEDLKDETYRIHKTLIYFEKGADGNSRPYFNPGYGWNKMFYLDEFKTITHD